MWYHVDLMWTDVSEERIASIFRVEKSASEEPAWRWRRYVPPKCRLTQDLHGATSQKTAFVTNITHYKEEAISLFWIWGSHGSDSALSPNYVTTLGLYYS
jgi:hypothetical protein